MQISVFNFLNIAKPLNIERKQVMGRSRKATVKHFLTHYERNNSCSYQQETPTMYILMRDRSASPPPPHRATSTPVSRETRQTMASRRRLSMQQESTTIQNNPTEWKPNSAKIHFAATSQSYFLNSVQILPD